jgi:protein SCO1/2
MIRHRHLREWLVLPLAAFLSQGQADTKPRSSMVSAQFIHSPGQSETVQLIDSTLVDQDGQPVKFASEAIGDRIVAINFIYTSCTTVCPLVSATFMSLQGKLGEHLGKDVRLISISLDPVTDTPTRLKDNAVRFKAKPGWVWLTGNKPEVDLVLKALGTSSTNFTEHAPMVVVGDRLLGQWSRFYGLTGPEQIRHKMEEFLDNRKRASRVSKASP